MEIFGLIENMSGLTCPHCGETIELFGAGGGERTAKSMNIDFLGRIPIDPNMVKCGDAGISFQEQYTDSPVSLAFNDIAKKMGAMVQP